MAEDKNKDKTSKQETLKEGKVKYISGMYENWFLDYASYVILERAVPHVADGLKPVQRRILHSMKRMDDGRYNKVANIIGHTMQFHPHGDASIGDALVGLGQKDLLIDTQGNWGNTLTGDSSAAPRYIEARLSKFALDVVFNPKTTKWRDSYDGRNKEPVNLPVKFPLLLAQGIEGIAVGLASKVMPHNFNELIEASIKHLKGKEFELYPDFVTGGMADFSEYNDGLRGGRVKVRAKIEKTDKRILTITELPFGKTTDTLIDSILSANEKGKIKVSKIEDNTSDKVEITIHLANGISPDKMIDALYAVTDCEVSISPNAAVIYQNKPVFMGVSEILKTSTENTKELLKRELEIRLDELVESWHMSSLEKIFIENRIYNDIEDCETWEEIIETIDKGLEPFKKMLKREVTNDDIAKLTEIKIKRISKFDSFKADRLLKSIEEEMKTIENHLANLVDYAIAYFKDIQKKHGKGRERKTEIRSFEEISVRKVVVKSEKLYLDKENGFAGTSLRKAEYISDCSDIDDIIVFRDDGTYFVTQVDEKFYVGKNIMHIAVWKNNDERTIYNAIYFDGKSGNYYMKRFFVKSVTRDKEYDLTKGNPNSKVLWFTANPNGEAETVKIIHRPRKRLKKKAIELDFSELAIKGRRSMGNLVTKYPVKKIMLKEEGASTLGGRKIWFDSNVNRLNTEERGKFLGEFKADEKIIVFYKDGTFETTSYSLENRYDNDVVVIEKFDPEKTWSLVYFEGEQNYYYLKRFKPEEVSGPTSIIGDHEKSEFTAISDAKYPRFEISFKGKHKDRDDETVEAEEFIGEKSFRARGKRLTTYEVKTVSEIEPLPDPEEEEKGSNGNEPEFEVTQTDEDGNQIQLKL
jgi:topoisomerase-4 subunit A